MSKSRFNSLLKSHSFSLDDTDYLRQVIKEKPYFQGARAMLAKASVDTNHEHKKVFTNFALVYSTNRKLLKSYLQGSDAVLATPAQEATVLVSKSSVPESDKPSSSGMEGVRHLSDKELESLRLEVTQNLELLKTNMTEFFEHEKKTKPSPPTPKRKSTTAKKSAPAKTKTTGASTTKTSTGRVSKKKAVEKDKKEEVKEPPARSTRKPKQNINDEVIEHTASHVLQELKEKEPHKIKSKLQKEQIKLIDSYLDNPIELHPSTPADHPEPVKDLSSSSIQAREDVVSENLANILLKQGKKDSAIDIFKKLIWKYPQKKVYFASRIEELKKV